MARIVFFLSLFFLFSAGVVVAGDSVVGSIKNIQGSVFVDRQGETLSLAKDMKIYRNDEVWTGKDGSVGIILLDNTIFSMGPDSRLALKEFVFSPDQGRFSLIARMLKGTFVYLSGIMGKLSPESIKLETPVGTIAIRGTRFAAKIVGE